MKEISEKDTAAGEGGLTVDATESGMKLIGFLGRRLELPAGLLHRWIRTGQVRIGTARAKAFDRVKGGDAIRIPPFARAMAEDAARQASAHGSPKVHAKGGDTSGPQARERASVASDTPLLRAKSPRAGAGSGKAFSQKNQPLPGRKDAPADRRSGTHAIQACPRLEVVGRAGGLFAVFKPAGIPTHPGTGHGVAVSTSLAAMSPDSPFPPTPVHRLDRDTSGVLLAASDFESLREAQDLFRSHQDLSKEYLAWVCGTWHMDRPLVLRHWLSKKDVGGRERMVASSVPGDGLEAVLACRFLKTAGDATLLQIRLFTGRTHQIRVQLSASGHPIAGDAKYGGSGRGPMLLHALRLTLPGGRVFEALPRWTGRFAVTSLPSPLEAANPFAARN